MIFRRISLLAAGAAVVLAGAGLSIPAHAAPVRSAATADVACVTPWNSTTAYTGGDQASYDGHNWTARWWTRGDTPGNAEVWTDDGNCGGGGTPPPTDCAPPWSGTTVYTGGDKVSYGGHNWTARWWTQGATPGSDSQQVWTDDGPCGTVVTAPATPTDLTATGHTDTTVTLTWHAADRAASYTVYSGDTTIKSHITGTTYTVTGLTAGTKYHFTVTASNSAGESAHSAAVTVTTDSPPTSVPKPPKDLTVTATTTSTVALSWQASDTAASYTVYRGDAKVSSGVTATSYTATGLSADTTYHFTVTASNAVGESGHSASVSATTPPSGPRGSLPKHVLTGYWQDFVNGATPLRLSDVPTGYNLVAVAFATKDAAKPGAVQFSLDPDLSSTLGGYATADFKADIDTLHSRGQRVILSVGGAKGTVSVSSSAAASNFASSVIGLMNTYGFDGVDIDLENGVSPTYMAQALHQIASAGGAGTIITMAPQTIGMQSTGRSYFKLALKVKDVLTIVNMQYYNSGAMLGCDGKVYSESSENFLTALACIQLQGGLDPSQVGLGLPASPSGAGGGYLSPSTVNDALDCLAAGTSCGTFTPPATWPAIRGAMDWSINWDASNGYRFEQTIAPHLAAMP